MGETIGQGTFCKVKKATHMVTRAQVAVKIIDKSSITKEVDAERVAKEIEILKEIHHPHVIQLYEIIEATGHLYVVMELAGGGELFEYIVQMQKLSEPESCRLLQQIMSGVGILHQAGIVHRDLKPENLYVFSMIYIIIMINQCLFIM